MEDQNKNNQSIIESVNELLSKMDIKATVEEGMMGDTSTFVIRTSEAGLLIGEDGQNLLALNYLLRKMAEKKLGQQPPYFIIDVNDYQRRRFDELKDRARMGAQRVRYFKKEVALQPMDALERRVVHMALQEYPDITTQSTGEGPQRRVVIKPYP
ncbi:protein jag [Patescibacteria group bacterium]